MISVLVVEDSPVARDLLVHILTGAGLKVVGVASDGIQAVEMVRTHRPDVVTMDIVMPRMNGVEATRRIMESTPVPIVIVSGIGNPREVGATFKAMEAGALAMVRRPAGPGHPEFTRLSDELLRTVRLMSEVKVIRRWSDGTRENAAGVPLSCPPPCIPAAVAIGASTGGPPVLNKILSGLTADFPLPVVIVQHLAVGFLPGMVDWLRAETGMVLEVAADGASLTGGHAYFAPEGRHTEVSRHGTIALVREDPEHGARPSVCRLFRSVAASFGERGVGVLLTGMGEDGAGGLVSLRMKGAITIAQEKNSCAVYGMPAAAVARGAALHVLRPDEIAPFLREIAAKALRKRESA